MSGILTRKGINAQRHVNSSQTNYDDELADIRASTGSRFLYRAVVVDVIFDVGIVTDIVEKFKDNILNPDVLATAPRNSVIARIVSAGADRRNQTPAVFYPTMSHTHEPIKPGEHVWVFYEDPQSSTEQGFWLSRIVEPRDVDDVNFTHADRKFVDEREPSTIDRLRKTSTDASLDEETRTRLQIASGEGPKFPNGADTEETYTLGEVDGYEKINAEAFANKVITKEAVPRFNKRPGDWVAEGSNNSLIVLGDDRTSATFKRIGEEIIGKPDGDKASYAGMIDLVVGRAFKQTGLPPQPGDTPSGAEMRVIKNSRGDIEIDKSVAREYEHEGDVSFENDLSRLYLSMDTDIDKNFVKSLPALNSSTSPASHNDGPAAVLKSNNIRIIARQDGAIRIIKEGDENDEAGSGRAVIMIENDGTIMIDGPRVIIGSGIEKQNGAGQQVIIGRDAVEPVVLGNALKDLLTEYTSNVQSTFNDVFTTVINGPAGIAPGAPGSFGNFGIPLPGMAVLLAAFAQINAKMTTNTQVFQNKLDTILSRIAKTK